MTLKHAKKFAATSARHASSATGAQTPALHGTPNQLDRYQVQLDALRSEIAKGLTDEAEGEVLGFSNSEALYNHIMTDDDGELNGVRQNKKRRTDT